MTEIDILWLVIDIGDLPFSEEKGRKIGCGGVRRDVEKGLGGKKVGKLHLEFKKKLKRLKFRFRNHISYLSYLSSYAFHY